MSRSKLRLLNGRTTKALSLNAFVNEQLACVLSSSNYWCSTEYNSNNAWNVNFNSGDINNNNKYNSNYVRAVAALDNEELVSFIEAYKDCCRNKMGSSQCVSFRLNIELLYNLALSIKNRTYEPSVSEAFVVTLPKPREIFAASFIDRIVQHWAYLRLNPLFEKRFISLGNVSFNCRKGFGTISIRKRVYTDMHHWGFSKQMFVGKFDIKSFFMSIDINILWQQIESLINEQYEGDDKDTLLYLSKIIIYHRPQSNCIKKGRLGLWQYIPPSKSLLCKDDHTGMAIGNITSQVFCNYYMSFFDEWLLNRIQSLGYQSPERHYARFVDDFVVHSMQSKHIVLIFKEATIWLREHLHLELHQDKVYIQPQRHGVKFIGGVILPRRIYIANTTINSMFRKMQYTNTVCRSIYKRGGKHYNLSLLERCVSSLNSYNGFLKHGYGYNIQKRVFENRPFFWKICYTRNNLSNVKIIRKYKLSNYVYNEEIIQQRNATIMAKNKLTVQDYQLWYKKGKW